MLLEAISPETVISFNGGLANLKTSIKLFQIVSCSKDYVFVAERKGHKDIRYCTFMK